MTTCDAIAAVAAKLELSQDQMILIYSFNRFGVNRISMLRAMALAAKIVEKFNLSDSAFESTYGAQLIAKGILTEAEGAFFDGDVHEEALVGKTTISG
jgi:hypothetical protein